MNTSLVSIAVGAVLFVALWAPADAQVGNDNPTGPGGIFNGDVTTANDYDPYTGNARRPVTDIAVAGAVGTYPLAFTRTYNSRNAGTLQFQFGNAPLWRHSYDWAVDSQTSQTPNFVPGAYTVSFPDGRVETFSGASDGFALRAGAGVRERFIPLNTTTMLAYLVLSDNGKVEFAATASSYKDQVCDQFDHCQTVTFYKYTYRAQAIYDPYGLKTTLSYNSNGLYLITEPAGRYIQLNWTTTTWNDRVIGSVTWSDGRSVSYHYAHSAFSPGTFPYTYLDQVTYYGDPNLVARYTLTGPNTGNVNSFPLLKTCIDPLNGGPMWMIAYTYATALNPNGTPPVIGQIKSENYFDGSTAGAAVSSLTINSATTRTETRGDGPTRTFTYSGNKLSSGTDFNNKPASQGYDANGYINSVTDRNNHTTNYTLKPLTGVPTQVKFPATPLDAPSNVRGTINYTYGGDTGCNDLNNTDTNNPYYVCTATDEANHVTRYSRYGPGPKNKRISRVDYPDGGFETFDYDGYGHVTSHLLTTGGTETFAYYLTSNGDPAYLNGLLKEYRDPLHSSGNPTARYRYDTLGRVTDVTDALGASVGDPNHTTSYAYNSRGQVTVTTHPIDPVDGIRHTVINAYDITTGTLSSMTDELSHVTSYTYDDYRRLLTTTDPLNHTTTNSYLIWNTSNPYTRTAATVYHQFSPTGLRVDFNYDANLQNIAFRRGMGTVDDDGGTYYGYDNVGNITAVVAPKEVSGQEFAGRSSTTTYDERNRPYQVKDDLDNITTFRYDAGGRKASITRANGQVVTFDSYDEMNRLLQQTATQSPEPNAVTKYTYYPYGLLKTMQDPRLVATSSNDNYSYVYDSMGRKTNLTYPPASPGGAQKTEIWHYDTAGRLDKFTNRAGKIQTISYDQLNRVIQSSWNDGGITPTVTTNYDAASRVVSITNANAIITRDYYNDNRLKLETTRYADAINRTVTYTYDNDGRRASLKYPSSAYTFNYTYTNRSQLDAIVNNANNTEVANYTYDVNGNVSARALNNSTSSTYGYDAMDRAMSISHALTTGTPRTRTLTYDYDSVGNRKWVKRDGGNGDAYGYDLSDQVTATKLNIANPDTTAAGPQTIVYDANGNRTSFAAYGTTDTYTINQLNQYTRRNTNQAVYDARGNMTTGLDSSAYTYDAQNRLLTATEGGTTDTFAYDGLNRQISRQVGTGAIMYNVYDGWDLIGEYASGSNTATNAYLFGATGLVKNLKNNRYYYQDASGSTTHLGGSAGAILEWYRYDLQGTPVFYNASNTQITATAYGVRHLFTGQQWYSEIGLYDLRNRFYSPDTGRFLQADPSGFNGDAGSLYRYCGNNPLTRSDPSGLRVGHVYKADSARGGPWGDRADSITSRGRDGSGSVGFGPIAGGVDITGYSGVTVAQANFAYSMSSYSVQQALGGFVGFLSIAQSYGAAGLEYAVNASKSPTNLIAATALKLVATGEIASGSKLTMRSYGVDNGLPSEDQAATAAIDQTMPSHRYPGGSGIEIGGGLFENKNGTWGYSIIDAETNGTDHCAVRGVPNGFQQLAAWHIHTGAPGTNAYVWGPNDKKLGMPDYLGMPNGEIWVYDPSNHSTRVVRYGRGG